MHCFPNIRSLEVCRCWVGLFYCLHWAGRPWEVHASQGLKVGLYTPTILGGNSYLSWFYDRGAIKDPAHTGTSKGLSQAINRGPIRKFLPTYANVTIQSHALSTGVRAHYVTANGVRDGLWGGLISACIQGSSRGDPC